MDIAQAPNSQPGLFKHLRNVADIASTGVDFISVGELTHSVKAADISLKIKSC